MSSALLVQVRERFRAPLVAQLTTLGLRVEALPEPRSVPDLVLVVVQSPDPVAVVERIRAFTAAPILVITDADSAARAAVLHAGADHCLGRDEHADVVVAQAAAMVRRAGTVAAGAPAPDVPAPGALRFDAAARTASVNGRTLTLSRREYELLLHLARNAGRALGRHALLESVWGARYAGDSNTVDVHVSWLRHKLPADSGVRITTLRGVGYRLDVL